MQAYGRKTCEKKEPSPPKATNLLRLKTPEVEVAEGKHQSGSRTEFSLPFPRYPSFGTRNEGLGGRRMKGARG